MTITPKSQKGLPAQTGFSLVETLVAISILLTALAGPLTIAARGIFAAGVARDQITAYYLAQEAMEYVHAVRDGNGLASLNTSPQNPPWLTGLSACQDAYCYVDAKTPAITACSTPSNAASCPYLKLDTTSSPNNPFYIYGGSNPDTSFKRAVRIEGTTDDERKVIVSVSWTTGGLAKSVSLVEHLRNWQSF